MSNELKALIFDVDGTLAETERDGHRLAFNQSFRDFGLDWQWSIELYGKLLEVSGGKERIRFYLDHYHPDFQPKDYPLEEFIAHLHRRKTQHYRELLAMGSIPLRQGVKRLINEARSRNIRLAIATTSVLPNVLALVEKHFDPDWFEIMAAGDIVSHKKPAPDIYYYVLNKLELAPQECLVFEDSSQGLKAATKAGLKTIITVNDYTRHQTFTQALAVLTHLGEPHQPMTVLSGKPINDNFISLDSLKALI